MGHCDVMYRVGYTPWEHPSEAWTSSLAQWPRGRPATGEGLSERIRRPGPGLGDPLVRVGVLGHDGLMAYDDHLADRVRAELEGRVVFAEKAMFGGLAFLVNTHMACGVMGEDLMVRVGKQAHDEAIAKGAREMDKTGRPMRGLVVVPGPTLDGDSLAAWLEQAVQFAESEPLKPPKPSKR